MTATYECQQCRFQFICRATASAHFQIDLPIKCPSNIQKRNDKRTLGERLSRLCPSYRFSILQDTVTYVNVRTLVLKGIRKRNAVDLPNLATVYVGASEEPGAEPENGLQSLGIYGSLLGRVICVYGTYHFTPPDPRFPWQLRQARFVNAWRIFLSLHDSRTPAVLPSMNLLAVTQLMTCTVSSQQRDYLSKNRSIQTLWLCTYLAIIHNRCPSTPPLSFRVMVIGDVGCGKTHLIQTLHDLMLHHLHPSHTKHAHWDGVTTGMISGTKSMDVALVDDMIAKSKRNRIFNDDERTRLVWGTLPTHSQGDKVTINDAWMGIQNNSTWLYSPVVNIPIDPVENGQIDMFIVMDKRAEIDKKSLMDVLSRSNRSHVEDTPTNGQDLIDYLSSCRDRLELMLSDANDQYSLIETYVQVSILKYKAASSLTGDVPLQYDTLADLTRNRLKKLTAMLHVITSSAKESDVTYSMVQAIYLHESTQRGTLLCSTASYQRVPLTTHMLLTPDDIKSYLYQTTQRPPLVYTLPGGIEIPTEWQNAIPFTLSEVHCAHDILIHRIGVETRN
eukprot:GHVH01000971.1.p1 GENE.GHVH01000971.1~~GHVH01000971.1.p1  ORF type:complete len:560 (+),score=49.55 GHVH01000971.1:494-2173(+)